MKKNKIIQTFLFLTAVGISIFLLFFIITCTWIGFEAKSLCQDAQRQYGQDCVMSLISLLDDEKQSYKAKNSAIWALGEMGDRRALPILKKYYTGIIPARESLYKTISQYELKKAIRLADGGPNITAIFWRY